MARPVHYAAATTGGLYFDCYHRELVAHVENYRERQEVREAFFKPQPSDMYTYRGPVPNEPAPVGTPRRHTDLRKVTCRACWVEIEKLTLVKLGKRSPATLLA